MENARVVDRGSGRKGIPVTVVVLMVTSTVIIACNTDFVSCLNTNEVEALCNAESYKDDEMRAYYLGKVVDCLIDLTPVLNFKATARYPLWTDTGAFYGCSACNGHLSTDDCTSCLETISKGYVKNGCKGRLGMSVKLQDCRMRYEVYKFDVDTC